MLISKKEEKQMSEYVDKLCASVTKEKRGGDHKVMRKRIEDSTAETAYKNLARKLY
jgi:hypothetical protein